MARLAFTIGIALIYLRIRYKMGLMKMYNFGNPFNDTLPLIKLSIEDKCCGW